MLLTLTTRLITLTIITTGVGCVSPYGYSVITLVKPATVVVTSERPATSAPGSGIEICEDPTRGLLQNPSAHLHYRIWLNPTFGANGEPKKGPNAILPPGADIELYLPPGGNRLHYKSTYLTTHYGWQAGSPPRTINIHVGTAISSYGCYSWIVILPPA